MNANDPVELARHLDRVRRRITPCRAGTRVAGLANGWIAAQPTGSLAEYPSMSHDRVFWLAPAKSLSQGDVDEARAAARELGRPGMHIWLAPWAWNEGVEAMLAAAGAKPAPWVEYIALTREARAFVPERPSPFTVRAIDSADEAEVMRVLRGCDSWYCSGAADTALRMAQARACEIHAAFDGDKTVALGMLALDGDWAYLFAAGTAPEARRRGAQTALIASRVERAAAGGAKWCSCETNTTVATSLKNLARCGFGPVIVWRVYRWEFGAEGEGRARKQADA